jgi:tetratricopeptide (TPR) repeat protein
MACSHPGFGATSALDIYHQANIAYQQKEYVKAIELYENILSQGNTSPELYYNLANAYYKNNDVPHSILNFERALKMDPKDEDAQFNLKIASLKVIDKIDPVPQIFYKRWLDSMTRLFSPDDWSKILIALLWCSLLSSLIYLFGATVSSRKMGFIISVSLLVLFSVSFVLATKSHVGTYSDKSAIVMSASVYVKSSPDPKGNDLFIIHEGTKVELLDEIKEWKKIKLLNGSVGWLMTSEIEII